MYAMSGSNRSGGGPDERDAGSWASESVPLSIRREMLERELSRLGFRKAESHRGASASEGSSAQQESQSSHPQADANTESHGD